MNKPLPKLRTLEYNLTLPISGKQVTYRPYNVADERTLIAASSARDSDHQFYITNTLNVIQGVVTNGVDITKLPSIDVRFLLLHQRGKSVGEVVEFKYEGKPANVDISAIQVVNPKTKDDYKIMIDDNIGLVMKDLTFEDEIRASALPTDSDTERAQIFYKMIIASVHSIFTDEDVWVVGQDITAEDVEGFINDIPSDKSVNLYNFISEMPYMKAEVLVDGSIVEVTSKEVDFLG